MGEQIKKLSQGGVDFDSHPKDILPEDVQDAINIFNGVGKGGKYYIPQNIDGNRLVNFSLPAGTNKTVGWLEDVKGKSVIYFVQNSNGDDSILRWYPLTNLVIPVLQQKLGFTTWIANKNLVEELLLWTDGVVPQRSFNIVRAQRQDENGVFKKVKFNIYFDFINFRNGDAYSLFYANINTVLYVSPADQTIEAGVASFVAAINATQNDFHATSCGQFIEVEFDVAGIYDVTLIVENNIVTGLPSSQARRVFTNIYPDAFLETFINADKNPPICEPDIVVKTDSAINTNFIVSKIFQFRTRYVYVDNEKSSLSPISTVSLGIGNYIEIDFTDVRLNDENLTIIKNVEIYVKEGELGKWKFVDSLDRFKFGITRNYFNFFNDKAYNEIDDALAAKLFESIPITSEAQEVFDNRMGYGGNKEGYDQECVDLSLSVAFKPPPELYNIKGILVIRPLKGIFNGETAIDNNSAIFTEAGAYKYGFSLPEIGQSMGLSGFPVYLAGTEFYAVSKQLISSNLQDANGAYFYTNAAFNVVYANNHLSYSQGRSNNPFGFGNDSRDQHGAYIGDKFFGNTTHGSEVYSTFEIIGVPEGEYVIRIAGCETTATQLSSLGYQNSSGYTIAVGNAASSVSPVTPQGFEYKISVGANVISHDAVTAANANNVIYVGCSAVADLSGGAGVSSEIITGYLCDFDLTTAPTTYDGILSDTRIERALVNFNQSQSIPFPRFNTIPPNWSQLAWTNQQAVTDHNGFFWYATRAGLLSGTKIDSILVGATTQYFVTLSQGFKQDNTAVTFSTSYVNGYFRVALRNGNNNIKTLSRTFINGRVFDGIAPQEDVPVIATLGSWQHTDQIGEFTIPYYADTFFNVYLGGTRDRRGYIVFSSLNSIVVYNFANDELFIGVQFTGIQIDAISYNNTAPSRWYIFANNILADLLEEFLGISGFKRGLKESLAVIYYDRENRQTTVQEHIAEIYVPFPTENQIAGSAIISWAISSLPPDLATHFQIVRTQTVPKFTQFNVTSVTYVDSTGNSTSFTNAARIRIGINSFINYHDRYPNSNIGYTFERGDRIKFISNGAGNLFSAYVDSEVVNADSGGTWLEVEKSNMLLSIDNGTLFELYTPKPAESTLFYEFGECFEIYELNGVKYHRGQSQDQTATQDAQGTFQTGNVYSRFRNFVLGGAKYIEDSSVSDFYESFTTQTGRPQILNKESKQVFRPTAIRISNHYFASSLLNGFSSFEAFNEIEVDRVFGTIRVMKLMSQSVLLAICEHRTQPFYIGRAVVKTTTGTNLISIADDILNTADTLIGQRGTQHPQSVDSYNNNLWFWDNSHGVWVRYSSNGLEDVSRYKAKSKFIELGKQNFTNVVSGIDIEHGNVVVVFEGGDALGFNDSVLDGKNRWCSRYSFKDAEMIGRFGNQLIVWKEGEIWIHDNPIKNNFFGTQYTSQIKVVANENPSDMKSWQSISEESGYMWTPIDIVTITGSTPTMRSRLKKTDFKKIENMLYSAFKGDLNDIRFATPLERLINGQKLRGEVLTLLLENDSESYADLFAINIYWTESPRSNK